MRSIAKSIFQCNGAQKLHRRSPITCFLMITHWWEGTDIFMRKNTKKRNFSFQVKRFWRFMRKESWNRDIWILWKSDLLWKMMKCALLRIFEQLLIFQLPPEQADDHLPLSQDFHVEDTFPYSEIQHLLKKDECKVLRASFDVKERDLFVKELERRVKVSF